MSFPTLAKIKHHEIEAQQNIKLSNSKTYQTKTSQK